MPTVSQLRRKAKTITVEWVTDTEDFKSVPIQVTYDPSRITMDSQDMATIGTKTLHDFWRDQLLQYVTDWDLTEERKDDNGQPIKLPVSAESIKGLEIALVRVILNKVQDDAAPK